MYSPVKDEFWGCGFGGGAEGGWQFMKIRGLQNRGFALRPEPPFTGVSGPEIAKKNSKSVIWRFFFAISGPGEMAAPVEKFRSDESGGGCMENRQRFAIASFGAFREVRRKWFRSSLKRPRQALERPQSAPKGPIFQGDFPPIFSKNLVRKPPFVPLYTK